MLICIEMQVMIINHRKHKYSFDAKTRVLARSSKMHIPPPPPPLLPQFHLFVPLKSLFEKSL